MILEMISKIQIELSSNLQQGIQGQTFSHIHRLFNE